MALNDEDSSEVHATCLWLAKDLVLQGQSGSADPKMDTVRRIGYTAAALFYAYRDALANKPTRA